MQVVIKFIFLQNVRVFFKVFLTDDFLGFVLIVFWEEVLLFFEGVFCIEIIYIYLNKMYVVVFLIIKVIEKLRLCELCRNIVNRCVGGRFRF